MRVARIVDTHLTLCCALVVLAEFSSIAFSLPLAWPCYFLIGLILWKSDLKQLPILTSIFLLVPLGFMLANSSNNSMQLLLTVSMFVTIIFEVTAIAILKRTESWAFLVELITFVMLGSLVLIEFLFPNITATFVNYIAELNQVNASEVVFPPGIFITGIALEALLFVWLCSRVSIKLRPMSETLLNSANEIRIGFSLLVLSLVLPLILYIANVDFISVVYIFAFPYIIAGLSLASWLLVEYKKLQKRSFIHFIWLIFIFIYATLLPLALGILGLIDIGLNLREKYQNYLKRR